MINCSRNLFTHNRTHGTANEFEIHDGHGYGDAIHCTMPSGDGILQASFLACCLEAILVGLGVSEF